MVFNVAGALARKTEHMRNEESHSLAYAEELNKSLEFVPEIYEIDTKPFGKCFRVQSTDGLGLDYFPARDLVILTGSNFTTSYKAGEETDYMSITIDDGTGIYIKSTSTEHGSDISSVESTYWSDEALDFISSNEDLISDSISFFEYDTKKAAQDYATRTITLTTTEMQEPFTSYITKHKKAAEEYQEKLDSIFVTKHYDTVPSCAKKLNILPNASANYQEKGILTADLAAQITMTTIVCPEAMIADIKDGFIMES